MANRIITAATIVSLLTPLAACGNIGGGLALEPEHQAFTIADTQLPDHIVNGDFEYPGGKAWMKLPDTADWAGISRKDSKIYAAVAGKWAAYPGLDAAKFAWDSTETGYGTPKPGTSEAQLHTNEVEVQLDKGTNNTYAEMCAHQAGTAIYQDIATTPGVMYKIRLKHTSQSKVHADSMQVLIGAPGRETVVEMTRTADQNGLNKVGERNATIMTKASNEGYIEGAGSRYHDGQWATYEGTYLATGTVTRFTFKSISAYKPDFGNLLDDISFEKAYPLSYDMNGGTGGPQQKNY